MSSTVLQPSKVIDYGHTGKYAGVVGEEIGRTSGSRVNSGGSGNEKAADIAADAEAANAAEAAAVKAASAAVQKQLISQPGPVMWPPVLSAAKSVPATPLIPGITDASQAVQRALFSPVNPRPIVVPPLLDQPVPALLNLTHMTQPSSSRQPAAKVMVSKGLPTLAMMHDYAAAVPKNLSTYLFSVYPEWDGEIATWTQWLQVKTPSLRPQTLFRPPSIVTPENQEWKPFPFPLVQPSPRRQHGSEGRREKRSSRSRSPHSSRYNRRSPDRRSSTDGGETRNDPHLEGKDEDRRPSPRRTDEKRSPPRRTEKKEDRHQGEVMREDRHRGGGMIVGRPTERFISSTKEVQAVLERLAKKLLETSAAQSLSKQADLETVVKTLAPALLAELVKMEDLPIIILLYPKGEKPSSSPPSVGQKRPPSSASSSSSSTAKKTDSKAF
ncbi:hypothetical protein L3Q82_003964 [Scortum barcoo]|uniref:Uncharacterized protein n=1 Tax=Scortum barcoo TaxID=214431 RepID=A0ACB8X5T3_9TELE|nr:hypothetical protein L3Q82_003964 [Scortum barcoo]